MKSFFLCLLFSVNWANVYSQSNHTIVVDGREDGRIFQGIGGVSAGASSRLLYDYPVAERNQILDYLFKPGYGASLQILKVEIGGDTNSTSGTEASHMRSPNEVNCGRGYEWWLMKEAKKRNPNIKLMGLAWGSPGWVGDNFWVKKNIEYHLEWLNCAEENGLEIDYMGGWNEKGYNIDWYIAWNEALAEHYHDIEILGPDDCCGEYLWEVVDDMYNNEDFMNSIDHVGVHFACGHRSEHKKCNSPESAKALGKPLWMSENSAQNHDIGGWSTSRALNRMYIDARISGYMTWSLISAWYANIQLADTGLMLAQWPWSGYYKVDRNIWAFAHTAQFAKPGWSYIDNASGYLQTGASYVTLQSPDGSDDFSTIIETLDAKVNERVTFKIQGGISADSVTVWETNMRSHQKSDYFVKRGTIYTKNGEFEFTVKPGYVYTISTITGNEKGSARPRKRMSDKMELPYEEGFESYGKGDLARYFSDINGAFETAPCGYERNGNCYRQVLAKEPINWKEGFIQPVTIIGDPRWWGDYTISTDFLLEEEGYAGLVGRISTIRTPFSSDKQIAGYHLQVSSNDKWEVYRQDMEKRGKHAKHIISSGAMPVEIGKWHHMALKMEQERIDVILDGEKVASVKDSYFTTGQTALFVSPWQNAQFDNVKITPADSRTSFVPKNNMSIVSVSSEYRANQKGYTYHASNAIDDRPETVWHSNFSTEKSLPQSITIDLGGDYKVRGLTYQPRLDGQTSGMITEFNIYLSSDNTNFKKVKNETWPLGTATKVSDWGNAINARYIRLEGVTGENNSVSAGEIDVMISE